MRSNSKDAKSHFFIGQKGMFFKRSWGRKHEAIRCKPYVFWMQLGIENTEAAALLTAAGILQIDLLIGKSVA
jgi:hypothetical protein